ncbi:hypothetical protein DPMN_015759 [Dreissena polymorpha]|uniref:Uncharacterized protein n=1 Tax=Dreissena polymorpha TaxID=45954 RepID=A0A9D4ND91_DREPO|nr:hypothetical protein DPMN_015759 [Dreissena polymorpha]
MKPNSVYGVKFSELIALKQAEAESAKIRQKYTQQKAALLKHKAESEANFQVLSQQKAFEAAAAEIKHEALMACEKLWSRLDERYGKGEIVHQSITRRIESFPQLTYKDSKIGMSLLPANANDYEKKHIVSFPPFTAFVEFIREQATICKL